MPSGSIGRWSATQLDLDDPAVRFNGFGATCISGRSHRTHPLADHFEDLQLAVGKRLNAILVNDFPTAARCRNSVVIWGLR